MQKGSVNSPIRIDLSEKAPDEIAEYLQALLAIRYALHKKGLKLKIDRRSRPAKVRITPA
jgi:hypothetical protein